MALEDATNILDELVSSSQPYTSDGITVIDADTFIQEDGTRVRIQGVDAPETGKIDPASGMHQPQEAGADIATQILNDIMGEEGVTVTPTGEQSYGRQVAEVTDASGRDVGTRLIERGVARPTLFSGEEQRTAETTANVRLSGLFDEAFSEEDKLLNKQLAYEKEIRGFDPNYDAVASGPSIARGTLRRAIARGTDNTQALLYAATNAFGELTGLESIEDWGDEGVRRNMTEAALSPAEIGNFDDVKSLSDFWTYAVESIGEQIPNIALTATGAGATTMLARAAMGKALLKQAGARFAGLQPVGEAANVMKGIIAKDAARKMPEALAKSTIVRRAPLIGAAATTYPLGVGEVQQELKEGGITSPGTAFLAGLPIAALDAASFDVIFGKLFKGVKREIAEDLVSGTARALGFVREVGKGSLVGGLAEMPTETMQEIIAITARAYHDPTYEIFSDENLARLRETAIKAGIVGTAGGGFASGVQAFREQPVLPPPDETPLTPEPEALSPEGVETPPPPTEDVIEVDAIESIPEGYTIKIEGQEKAIDAREYIAKAYDEPISGLEELARCIGG